MIEILASGGRARREADEGVWGWEVSARDGAERANLPEDYTSVYYHRDLFLPPDPPLERES